MSLFRSLILGIALACTAALALAAPASAYVDPPGCTADITYDADVPTFEEVVGKALGAGGTGTTPRNPSADIYKYFDAMVTYTENHPRV